MVKETDKDLYVDLTKDDDDDDEDEDGEYTFGGFKREYSTGEGTVYIYEKGTEVVQPSFNFDKVNTTLNMTEADVMAMKFKYVEEANN